MWNGFFYNKNGEKDKYKHTHIIIHLYLNAAISAQI